MPVYTEADDSDAWHDDESMTSTDDFSSHTGDIETESLEDSDFEFLSRSSSQAHTEEEVDAEETDSDDITSIHTTDATASIATGFSLGDTLGSLDDNSSLNGEDLPADSVLQSVELPSVVREPVPLEDSTSTITQSSRQRRDTVTPQSITSNPADSPVVAQHGLPFNILYAGSSFVKTNVLRKIGQALMTATMRDRSDPSMASTSPASSINTDWSSGYTSVVPITDFASSDTAPEVEFVEDSLVKLKVQEIDSIQGFATRRQSQFMCQVDQNTLVISCAHRHHGANRCSCPWIDATPDRLPSLLVYVSSARGEKTMLSLKKFEEFSHVHHIPLLSISEWEVPSRRYNYRWVGDTITAEHRRGVSLEYTPKAFFEMDSLELGRSLLGVAAESKRIIQVSSKVCLQEMAISDIQVYRIKWQKRVFMRTVAALAVMFLLYFFKVPFFAGKKDAINLDTVYSDNMLITTPTLKELGTKYVDPSELMSVLSKPPSTVTVTEQLTVTVPIVHTKTVTTSTTVTPAARRQPASTIVLNEITSSVNVPLASLPARLPDTDYGYAFGYDDSIMQMFLETDRSVLLRLPGVYRESTSSRPSVKIAVTRDGKPVDFELREWKKNDLVFITWDPKESHDHLEIKVWTDSHPVLKHQVLIGYSEPIIDPRLWESLQKSHKSVWKHLLKFRNDLDDKLKSVAKEVHSAVSDPQNYAGAEEKVAEYMRLAKKMTHDVQGAAERQFQGAKSKYPRLFTKPTLTDDEFRRFIQYKEQVQKQMDEYVRAAQHQAVSLAHRVEERFGMQLAPKKQGVWTDVKEKVKTSKRDAKEWYKTSKQGHRKRGCGKGGKCKGDGR